MFSYYIICCSSCFYYNFLKLFKTCPNNFYCYFLLHFYYSIGCFYCQPVLETFLKFVNVESFSSFLLTNPHFIKFVCLVFRILERHVWTHLTFPTSLHYYYMYLLIKLYSFLKLFCFLFFCYCFYYTFIILHYMQFA